MINYRSQILSIILAYCLIIINCSGDDSGSKYKFTACTDIASPTIEIINSPDKLTISNWLYRLQFTEANGDDAATAMAAHDFDLVVMDYSLDGSDDNKFTTDQITTIKKGGTVKVLAYLSIGEAEDYRYYFNDSWVDSSGGQPNESAPCWLNRTNEDWAGNYKVQYWSEQWQTIILSYLDKIIDAGFDGVYLDIIDGFEHWADDENNEGYTISEALSAEYMIKFLSRIAYRARHATQRNKPNFLIFPQNGENILDYDTEGNYLNVISGIGIEDLYYDETTPQSSGFTDDRIYFLEPIKGSKNIIVVDYVDTGNHAGLVPDFYQKCAVDEFTPYAAIDDRELDEINFFSGQGAAKK